MWNGRGAGVDVSCLTHVDSLPPGAGPSANPAAHLVSRGGDGPEVRCLPFGAAEPTYALASQAPPGGLGPIGARPSPAPWQGTPALLWEEKLLFISHPHQRAHDAPSLACVLWGAADHPWPPGPPCSPRALPWASFLLFTLTCAYPPSPGGFPALPEVQRLPSEPWLAPPRGSRWSLGMNGLSP